MFRHVLLTQTMLISLNAEEILRIRESLMVCEWFAVPWDSGRQNCCSSVHICLEIWGIRRCFRRRRQFGMGPLFTPSGHLFGDGDETTKLSKFSMLRLQKLKEISC